MKGSGLYSVVVITSGTATKEDVSMTGVQDKTKQLTQATVATTKRRKKKRAWAQSTPTGTKSLPLSPVSLRFYHLPILLQAGDYGCHP